MGALFCLAPADCLASTRTQKIESLIRSLANRGQFSGSIVVVQNGRATYRGSFGEADVEKKLMFTPDTPVYLASLTKQFTALAVMMLEHTGQLSYDDTLAKYFPEFPDYAQQVTLRSLLNHTAGIPDYVALGLERPGLTDIEVKDLLVRRPSPDFKPGERFQYSNSGYVLLGLIIEKVSGEPYARFLSTHIFKPLGMTHSFVYTQARSAVKRARGYDRFGEHDDYNLLTYGEGGIYSSASDMFKWDQALYTDTLLPQRILQQAFTRGMLNDGARTGYGFGWVIADVNSQPVYSHAGRYGGFNTYIKRFPNERTSIIFLTNHGFRNMSEIGSAIIAILHDRPYTLPKLSVAESMYQLIRKSSVSDAIHRYRELRQAASIDYDFDESELNELGYELMGQNRLVDAIQILKLNVEAYPDSGNVYDGLGEAYMKHGDRDLAIKNYKRSLELDPKNSNAVEMLKKLGVS